VRSLDEAIKRVEPERRAFVIGGGQLYAAALVQAATVYETLVQGEFEGDTFFPELSKLEWRLVENAFQAADDDNPYPCFFRVYERRA